jgi:hypothetical protein
MTNNNLTVSEAEWAFQVFRGRGEEHAPARVIERAIALHEEEIAFLKTLAVKNAELL